METLTGAIDIGCDSEIGEPRILDPCAAVLSTIEALEIPVVFERDMMVHRDISLTQPFGSTGSERHSMIVDTHQPSVAHRVDRECDFLGGIKAAGGGTVRQKDKLVRLSNCLPRVQSVASSSAR
jgi:hypothetical protein